MLKKESRIDTILSKENKTEIKKENFKSVIDDIINRKSEIDEPRYNQTLSYLYGLDNDEVNRKKYLDKFKASIEGSDYINMGIYSFLAQQLVKSKKYSETLEMLKEKGECEHSYYFVKKIFLYKGISLIELGNQKGYKYLGFAYKIDPSDLKIETEYNKYKTQIENFYKEYYSNENISNKLSYVFYESSETLRSLIDGSLKTRPEEIENLSYDEYENLLDYVYNIVWDLNHPLMQKALELTVKAESYVDLILFLKQFYRFDTNGIAEILKLFKAANLSSQMVFSKMLLPDKYKNIEYIKKLMEKYITKNDTQELIEELTKDSYENNIFFYSLYGYFATKYNQDLYNKIIKEFLNKKSYSFFTGALLQFISDEKFVNESFIKHLENWTKKNSKTDKISLETFRAISKFWNTMLKDKDYYKAIDNFNSKLPKKDYSSFALNFLSGGNIKSPFYKRIFELALDFDCYNAILNERESKDYKLTLTEFQDKYSIPNFYIMKYIIISEDKFSYRITDKEISYYLKESQDNLAKILKQVAPKIASVAIKNLKLKNKDLLYKALLATLDVANKELKSTIVEALMECDILKEDISLLLSNKKKSIREGILLVLTKKKASKEIKNILKKHLEVEKTDSNKKIIKSYLK